MAKRQGEKPRLRGWGSPSTADGAMRRAFNGEEHGSAKLRAQARGQPRRGDIMWPTASRPWVTMRPRKSPAPSGPRIRTSSAPASPFGRPITSRFFWKRGQRHCGRRRFDTAPIRTPGAGADFCLWESAIPKDPPPALGGLAQSRFSSSAAVHFPPVRIAGSAHGPSSERAKR